MRASLEFEKHENFNLFLLIKLPNEIIITKHSYSMYLYMYAQAILLSSHYIIHWCGLPATTPSLCNHFSYSALQFSFSNHNVSEYSYFCFCHAAFCRAQAVRNKFCHHQLESKEGRSQNTTAHQIVHLGAY